MLTAKQKAFCQEYMIDLNATQAAIRAGYSERTAKAIGHETLTKPDVSSRIAELQAERQERTTVTADDVVNGLLENHKAARDVGKYSDSNKALELLGKHLGLFTDKHEISSPGGKPIDKEWTVRFVSPGDKLD
jgi:phage terminase small subunit